MAVVVRVDVVVVDVLVLVVVTVVDCAGRHWGAAWAANLRVQVPNIRKLSKIETYITYITTILNPKPQYLIIGSFGPLGLLVNYWHGLGCASAHSCRQCYSLLCSSGASPTQKAKVMDLLVHV